MEYYRIKSKEDLRKFYKNKIEEGYKTNGILTPLEIEEIWDTWKEQLCMTIDTHGKISIGSMKRFKGKEIKDY